MKFALVVGTRPEIIKMAPIIRECQKRDIPFILIHSNQHYSVEMDKVFFDELGLPSPDYNLHVGSSAHGNQTGQILIKLEPILHIEKPTVLIAQGDTNTVLAAGLAASKLNIPVAHIEAGLRSYDRTMPEETNRVIVDHLSTYLFAVTITQKEILKGEGINDKKIHVVGNSVVDALKQNVEIATKRGRIFKDLGVIPGEYILATIHRSSNVDTYSALEEIFYLLKDVADKTELKIIWPIHPRTLKKIQEYKLEFSKNIKLIAPLGYLDFLCLENKAKLILTDSGGVQEEACILKVPCITLRENTERPETVDVGANILVGRSRDKMQKALNNSLAKEMKYDQPFGDGYTAHHILNILAPHTKSLREGIVRSETISVIGLGYMGLPMALLLAQAGWKVTGVDINQKKVHEISQGHSPFSEEGIETLLKDSLKKSHFKLSSSVVSSDVYIICVPTPHENEKCDLKYVIQACKDILPVVKNKSLVIIESTIRPRACIDVLAPIFKQAGLDVELVHCPERAIPGQTLYELVHNDRIIGGVSTNGSERAKKIYSSFVKGEIFETHVTTAECVKLMENTFRDVNIALANEFDQVLDFHRVPTAEAIRLANRHPRVSILSPGTGVGGHCIAIDPWFLIEGYSHSKIIKNARLVNDERPLFIVERIKKEFPLAKNIGLLGVAYKKNVDDARETPALIIYDQLEKNGFQVKAHDPFVTHWSHELVSSSELDSWADVLIMVTDHDTYESYQFKKTVFDPRNHQERR